ncbi:hypothetical protein B0H10DRAFT_1951070 [Mycena sp. CBHHK59/15]|nr:hypothetical protein B0H10DRAFT_1951070 [Mycena sp. CBHHK59/15]
MFSTRKIGDSTFASIGFGAMGISAFYVEIDTDEERYTTDTTSVRFSTPPSRQDARSGTRRMFSDSEEQMVGIALHWDSICFERTGKRNSIFVATKFGFETDLSVDGSPKHADEFNPERMLDGKFEVMLPDVWQPDSSLCLHLWFGFSMRACIGRPFTWQEVRSSTCRFVDPPYILEIRQNLTVKPMGLLIHAAPRTGKTTFYAWPSSDLQARNEHPQVAAPVKAAVSSATSLYVLYGSNTGTSEVFSHRIANEALAFGKPADNAGRFIDWLRNIEGKPFTNHGATRILPRSAGDASKGDFFHIFDDFKAKLWSALSRYSTSCSESMAPTLEVKTADAGKERATALRHTDTLFGTVVENRVLTKDGPEKGHIGASKLLCAIQSFPEFELTEGITVRAGDYIAMCVAVSLNFLLLRETSSGCLLALAYPMRKRQEASKYIFAQPLTSVQVILSSLGPMSLPVDKPVRLWDIYYTQRICRIISTCDHTRSGILAGAAKTESTRAYLEELKASYNESVLAKRLSVVEILDTHRDIELPLGAFLQMLPAMCVRQYSISSSPLCNPTHVTLIVSVLAAPARSVHGEQFHGLGSNYLASMLPGDRVQMAVRPSAAAFHPPEDRRDVLQWGRHARVHARAFSALSVPHGSVLPPFLLSSVVHCWFITMPGMALLIGSTDQ